MSESPPIQGSGLTNIVVSNLIGGSTGQYVRWGASSASWSNLVSADITTSLGFTPENIANKGIASGYAGLNSSSQITNSIASLTQLPSGVGLLATAQTWTTLQTFTAGITSTTVANTFGVTNFNGIATFTTGLLKAADVIDITNGNKCVSFPVVTSAVNYIGLQQSAAGSLLQVQAIGSDTNIGIKLVPKGTGICMGSCETIELDLTDETSLPTIGIKITTGIPYNFSLVAATAYLTTTGSGVTLVQMDALIESGVDTNIFATIFTTTPQIAAGKYTSNSSGSTPAVLTSTPLALTKDTRIQGKIVALDTNNVARGYKLLLVGYRTA